MIQLQSFSRLVLVLSVVPMGLIGIVAALLIFNKPLGFVAILGILALIGMIARNAVILIDRIEAERAAGKAVWDAVVEAAMSRFRPIMLTAVSTVLGMIPIAPTVFGGPMAYATCGGEPPRRRPRRRAVRRQPAAARRDPRRAALSARHLRLQRRPEMARVEMQAIIDAEVPSGERRARMIASFNRGYRGFQQTYRTCTPAADVGIRRYLEEGSKIAREMTARYAN